MKTHLKQGWLLASRHFFIVILLFLYQLLWGFFLYRFIDSIAAPLLRRFPNEALPDSSVQLFISEAQFHLIKTDLITPYAWLLGGLIAARMLLTPLFNAGLFYSFRHANASEGTRFLQGIGKVWRPVTLLYWIKTLLALAPAWWLLPRALQAALASHSIGEAAIRLLPGAAGWLLWAAVLHLLFLAMQFGAASGDGPFRSLWHALRHVLPYGGLSLLMWAIGAGVALFVTGLSFIWAGLIALIIHQGYNLIRTMMKVWTLAAQYDCLQSRSDI
ncbi:hypothetical protein [Paenibacillus sp. NPDC058071]|uniref:hypothetical protein n=1 Tax=Paenibacillus sp. NPDC058071 TaxID=3346326 RepID=UPI0036DE670E